MSMKKKEMDRERERERERGGGGSGNASRCDINRRRQWCKNDVNRLERINYPFLKEKMISNDETTLCHLKRKTLNCIHLNHQNPYSKYCIAFSFFSNDCRENIRSRIKWLVLKYKSSIIRIWPIAIFYSFPSITSTNPFSFYSWESSFLHPLIFYSYSIRCFAGILYTLMLLRTESLEHLKVALLLLVARFFYNTVWLCDGTSFGSTYTLYGNILRSVLLFSVYSIL